MWRKKFITFYSKVRGGWDYASTIVKWDMRRNGKYVPIEQVYYERLLHYTKRFEENVRRLNMTPRRDTEKRDRFRKICNVFLRKAFDDWWRICQMMWWHDFKERDRIKKRLGIYNIRGGVRVKLK